MSKIGHIITIVMAERDGNVLIVGDKKLSAKEIFDITLGREWAPIVDVAEPGKKTARQIGMEKVELIEKSDTPAQLPSYYDVNSVFYYVGKPQNARVLMLGQDPYDTPGFAMGLAFSMREGIPISMSLKNIFRFLEEKNGCSFPRDSRKKEPYATNGSLIKWAHQGVILLNTALTVEPNKAGSHLKLWTSFTERVIANLTAFKPLVIVLWGQKAQAYSTSIKEAQNHVIIKGPHPVERNGEFNNYELYDYFNDVNRGLEKLEGEKYVPINWQT